MHSAESIRIPDSTIATSRGNVRMSRDASRAGREKPVKLGALSAIPRRFLLSGRFMAAGSGQRSRWPVLVPVSHPAVSPPPITVRSDAADSNLTRSLTMSTSNQGEIRPISDRIESALILAESAVSLLERNQLATEPAADALIQAGLILLGKSGSTCLVPDQVHAELLAAIFNSKNALHLALGADDLGDGAGAVVVLVRDLMDAWSERFDSIHFDCVDVGREGAANGH